MDSHDEKVVERAVGALAVVKAFNVIEDFSACLAVADKVSAIDEVEFEGAPEASPVDFELQYN